MIIKIIKIIIFIINDYHIYWYYTGQPCTSQGCGGRWGQRRLNLCNAWDGQDGRDGWDGRDNRDGQDGRQDGRYGWDSRDGWVE